MSREPLTPLFRVAPLLHVPREELVHQVQELLAARRWGESAITLSQLLGTTTPEATFSAAQSLVEASQAPATASPPPAPHPALDKLLALTDSLSQLLRGASTLDETRIRLHALLQGTNTATLTVVPPPAVPIAQPTVTSPAAKLSRAKTATPAQPVKNPKKVPGSAEDRIEHALQAVMHHNDYRLNRAKYANVV